MFVELFERTCGQVAGDSGPGASAAALGTARGSFPRGWRLLAIDEFEVDVPDSPPQRGRVRVRRVRGEPVGVPQGAGGRAGRVRHPLLSDALDDDDGDVVGDDVEGRNDSEGDDGRWSSCRSWSRCRRRPGTVVPGRVVELSRCGRSGRGVDRWSSS